MSETGLSKISSPLEDKIARNGEDWDSTPANPDDTFQVEIQAEPGHVALANNHADSVVERAISGYGRTIVAVVRADRVKRLAVADSIRKVQEYRDPMPLTTSEGVGISNADQLHSTGVSGDGIQIAIIDGKFDISNDKISDNIVGTIGDSQYFYTESEDGTDRLGHHGTGCAEIVVDMAPDCDLVLATVHDSNLTLFDILDELETNWNPAVASMSMGYAPTDRLDGLDDRSTRIDDFTDNGRTFAVSAGNEANGHHWDGPFTDTDGDDLMEFDDNGNELLQVDNPYAGYTGSGGDIIVQWDADWDQDNQQYAVYLYDTDRNQIDSSFTTTPVEVVTAPDSLATVYVAIERGPEDYTASGDEHFDIFTWGGAIEFPVFTRNRSMLIPATSRDPETFATAAVQATDTGIEDSTGDLKRYSSRGPSQDGRRGIDIAGPSRVSQLDSENDGFNGTSAAAPHIAGALGLLAAFPTVGNEDIRESLHAPDRPISDTDVGDPPNETIGTGYLDAKVALEDMIGLRQQWSRDTGDRAQFSTPAVDDQRVYVGGLGQDVYAYARDGSTVEWSMTRDGSLSDSSPVLHNGQVFVGSGGGTLVALDATNGSENWSHSTGSAIVSSPTVLNGVVFVGSNDGTVYAKATTDGAPQWNTDVGASVFSDVAAANGRVFVTTNEGDVVALDAANGSEQWRVETNTELGASSPTVSNETVYVAADDVYALNATDGSELWREPYGGMAGSNPAVMDGLVYVGSADGTVYALDDAANGSVVWSYATGDAIAASPTAIGRRVTVASMDGNLYVFNAADGTLFGSTSLPSKTRSTPVVVDNDVYIGSHSGTFVSL